QHIPLPQIRLTVPQQRPNYQSPGCSIVAVLDQPGYPRLGDRAMRYTHFTVKNFKGIEHVHLNLEKAPKSRVHTLVGLNESGKTTVLEAIDRLAYRESLDALEPEGFAQADVHDLIPIAKRANFNGEIIIEASVL